MKATEFIQKFFTENPKASVNDCAREMDKVKVEGTFDTSLISRIRMKERQKNSFSMSSSTPVIPDKGKPLSQPPIVRRKDWRDSQTWWKDGKPKEEAKVEEKVEAPKVPVVSEAIPSESITTRKRHFVNSYLEKFNPEELAKQTCHSIQEAVKKEFTTGLDFKYVAETLRIAKEMANIPMKRAPTKKAQKIEKPKKRRSTAKPQVKEESTDRLVSWGSNEFKILRESKVRAFVTDLLMGTAGKPTVDPATIRVWKPVPANIRLQIDIG